LGAGVFKTGIAVGSAARRLTGNGVTVGADANLDAFGVVELGVV
jgi:hypothetical protein